MLSANTYGEIIVRMDFKTRLIKEPFNSIIGQKDTLDQIKSALLVDRHIILVGPPGTGKTTIAKSVATLLPSIQVNDCNYNCLPEKPVCPECKQTKAKIKDSVGVDRFIRVQGSPDLTAEDLIGDIDPVKAMKHGALSLEAFQPGKIFKANNGVLFFDEINRCSEKLQNALLQALEEGYVTIGSYTVDIPVNMIFIGTMNPNDSSTEDLSDVFLDRFDLIYVDYPSKAADELTIVTNSGKNLISFPEKLLTNTIEFIRDFRTDPNILKKPSIRASLGIFERAQANAMIANRTEVNYDDVNKSMQSVLSHRMELKPSKKYLQSNEEYIAESMKEFFKTKGDGL